MTVKNQGTASGAGGWLDVWAHSTASQSCGATGNKYVSVGARLNDMLERLAAVSDADGNRKGICFVELLPGARNSSFANLLLSRTKK